MHYLVTNIILVPFQYSSLALHQLLTLWGMQSNSAMLQAQNEEPVLRAQPMGSQE